MNPISKSILYVAIDIAKIKNDVLVELPNGSRRKMKVFNRHDDYEALVAFLHPWNSKCMIGLEATGNYHRTIAHYLLKEGFNARLISSVALSKTREALHNSWDKNDPKDAQVILHMLKSGMTQVYFDIEDTFSFQTTNETMVIKVKITG